jgi:putative flippase GtrA
VILTDREWLRFVTFGILAGSVLGASYTAALLLRGHPFPVAIALAVAGTGILAVLVHLAIRYGLDRATDPPSGDDAAESPADHTDTDTNS